jgi:hypothetical protein
VLGHLSAVYFHFLGFSIGADGAIPKKISKIKLVIRKIGQIKLNFKNI